MAVLPTSAYQHIFHSLLSHSATFVTTQMTLKSVSAAPKPVLPTLGFSLNSVLTYPIATKYPGASAKKLALHLSPQTMSTALHLVLPGEVETSPLARLTHALRISASSITLRRPHALTGIR